MLMGSIRIEEINPNPRSVRELFAMLATRGFSAGGFDLRCGNTPPDRKGVS